MSRMKIYGVFHIFLVTMTVISYSLLPPFDSDYLEGGQKSENVKLVHAPMQTSMNRCLLDFKLQNHNITCIITEFYKKQGLR